MPKPHPREFRDDVVAVARKGEAPIAQIAKDFGISESCLRNWLHRADVEDGVRSGTTEADAKELRDAKRRIRLLEQEKGCSFRQPVRSSIAFRMRRYELVNVTPHEGKSLVPTPASRVRPGSSL